MNNREMDFIQKAIDGTLTSSEHSRFRTLVAGSDEFRAAFNSHQAVARALNTVAPIDSPEKLRHTIMTSIDQNRYSPSPATVSLGDSLEQLGSRIRNLLSMRYVATFVAGAATTCLLFAVVYDWTALDSNSLSGTIGGSALSSAETRTVHQDITFVDGAGRIELAENTTGIYAVIDLKTVDTVLIRIVFDNTTASVSSDYQDLQSDARIQIQSNRVNIEHQGDNRYIIKIKKTDELVPSLTFTLEDIGGEKLYSGKMTLD